MAWEQIGSLDTLAIGDMRQHDRGEKQYVVCRMDGGVFVLDNECPHSGGPLSMGNFSPPLLVCPWHAWEFDCRTGQCVHSTKAVLRTYPVDIRDGWVFANFPNEV